MIKHAREEQLLHLQEGYRDEKYVRIPYAKYKMETNETHGYVEIGDFMMQWGKTSNQEIAFKRPFGECYGILAMPANSKDRYDFHLVRRTYGQDNVIIRELESTRAYIFAGSSERPFVWFAYGSRKKREDGE